MDGLNATPVWTSRLKTRAAAMGSPPTTVAMSIAHTLPAKVPPTRYRPWGSNASQRNPSGAASSVSFPHRLDEGILRNSVVGSAQQHC